LVTSRINSQLRGNEYTAKAAASSCKNSSTNEEIGATHSYAGTPLDPEEVAIPCGNLAKYHFTDRYELDDSDGIKIEIDETGIAWKVDQNQLFVNHENSEEI